MFANVGEPSGEFEVQREPRDKEFETIIDYIRLIRDSGQEKSANDLLVYLDPSADVDSYVWKNAKIGVKGQIENRARHTRGASMFRKLGEQVIAHVNHNIKWAACPSLLLQEMGQPDSEPINTRIDAQRLLLRKYGLTPYTRSYYYGNGNFQGDNWEPNQFIQVLSGLPLSEVKKLSRHELKSTIPEVYALIAIEVFNFFYTVNS